MCPCFLTLLIFSDDYGFLPGDMFNVASVGAMIEEVDGLDDVCFNNPETVPIK